MIMRWTCLVLIMLMTALTQGCATRMAWYNANRPPYFVRVEGFVLDPADASERKLDYLSITYKCPASGPFNDRMYTYRIDCEGGTIPAIMLPSLSDRGLRAIIDSISTQSAAAIPRLMKKDEPVNDIPESGLAKSVRSTTFYSPGQYSRSGYGRSVNAVAYWWVQAGEPSNPSWLWHPTADSRGETLDERCLALVLPDTVPKRRLDHCLDVSSTVLITPLTLVVDVVCLPVYLYLFMNDDWQL